MKFETKGIGTTWWIEVFDEKFNESVFQEIHDHIQSFEKKYSRFLQDSFVYNLNKSKVLMDFPKELFSMLTYCQSISELTDFRFNVCSGIIQEAHGYDERYSFNEKDKPSLDSIRKGIKLLSEERIEIDKNVIIDLGGIGKGWLVDTIKLILENNGYKYFSINGGGDIYVTSDNGKPITFYLENPFDNKEYVGTIELKDEAFACSSPSKRVWNTVQGNQHHHLINAKTGSDVREFQSVFTQGKTGLAVDTASTCIFISGENEVEFLAESLEVEYLLVLPDKRSFKSEGFKGELV